jgi:acetamidase/formamidase
VLRDLTAGSHLFLPVAKAGARIWNGDVHALQGDGVVDQTAIETAAEDLEIRYDLHKQVALRGPLGETDTAWIVIGFGGDLDEATVACVREVIHWLAAAAQVTESEAYALASMAVSFRVTQYANQTASAYSSTPPKAVHAVIPKQVFPAGLRDRVTAWLRPGQARPGSR